MSKLLWQLIKTTPVALGVSLLAANPGLAQNANVMDELNNYTQEMGNVDAYQELDDSMAQVNSVSQLRDVSPGDWAFEALRNLVERYGCIAGYPDRTFRGNQALTRYEFAAGLNACLQQIERLIGSGDRGMTEEEMQQLQRLTQEFQAELAAIGARVDNLEARVGVLEDNQFSTTTKLSGEVLFTAAGAFGDQKSGGGNIDDQITLSDRVRLNFDTSFTGKDRLRTRLTAGNFNSLAGATGTDMARLGHDQGGGNNVFIEDLYYRFPLGDKVRVWVGTTGLDLDDIFDVHNPYFEDSGLGAMSRFNRRNPLVYRGTEGAGAGVKFKFNDTLALTALYLADGDSASDPTGGNGLFNGAYSAGAQLDVNIADKFDVGLTYVYGYQPAGNVNLSGSTGSELAKRPFTNTIGTSGHHIGLSGQFQVTPKISLGAFGGYVNARAEESGFTDLGFVSSDDSADIWTWGANIAILDLLGEGNVLGLAGGQTPKLTNSDIGVDNSGTSHLIEAQYRLKVNDNITITPSVYVVLEPDHVDGASDIWVGAIRTTFRF
jgi:Carbohydrate-selective porin, OprB family/S-layer homology domain